MREFLTDEQVEEEIERLNASEAVRVARAEQRRKYRRRQYLYTLRDLEKRGLKLLGVGITEKMFEDIEDYDEEV